MTLEASLKQMSDTPVALVEIGGVFAVKILHAEGQVRVRRSEQEMVVVGHQDPGEQLPSVLRNRFLEQSEEMPTILIVEVDVPLLHAPVGDVPESTWVFESEGTGHNAAERK